MKSETNKHKLRTAVARTKLIEAAIAMIAARGLPGFALTKLGADAGVSRGLATYHFADRGKLIAAALGDLLETDAQPEGLGLPALLAWIADQADRAARRDPRLLALLQLAIGTGVDVETPTLREAYWGRRSQMIERHLRAAQDARQVRNDLEPSHLAGVLLGLLHGELLRIAATGEAPGPTFTSLIERALVREGAAHMKEPQKTPAAKRPRKTTASRDGGNGQGTLFGPLSDAG